MSAISATIKELNARIVSTENELTSLKEAVSILQKLGAAQDSSTKAVSKKRRKMSAAGRARIAAGQKARWAKAAKAKAPAKVEAKPAKKKRKLSAAGAAAIRAGVKARWEKIRAEKAKKTV